MKLAAPLGSRAGPGVPLFQSLRGSVRLCMKIVGMGSEASKAWVQDLTSSSLGFG